MPFQGRLSIVSRHRLLRYVAVLLIWLFNVGMAVAAPAFHPAPSVIHDYIVTLSPEMLSIEAYLRVSPELVPEVYRQIDRDGDGTTSEAEHRTWSDQHLATLAVSLDGIPVQLQRSPLTSLSREDLLLSIGHPIVAHYRVAFETPLAGKHRLQLQYGDNYLAYDEYYISVAGDRLSDTRPRNISRPQYPATYQVIYQIPEAASTAPGAAGQLAAAPYTSGTVAAPAPSAENGVAMLPTSSVPQTVLPTTTVATDAVVAGGVAQTTGPDQPAPNLPILGGTTATVGRSVRVLDMLRNWHGNPWSAFTMLMLALSLGALHALTPGHGKAVVAAYLIGSRGRVRDAVLLGWVVTITHTAGVVLLGIILLLVSNFSLPRALQPALELTSGVLVLALGIYLLIQRWQQLRRPLVPAHSHDHTNETHTHDDEHTHSHDDAEHTHSHAGHVHSYAVPNSVTSLRALIGLGISGGLVPCPDALAILLLAFGVGQIGLGIGLVASFSLGLAGVLILIGVALVKMKAVVERRPSFGPSRNPAWMRWVPVVSAAVVAVVGLLMTTAAFAKPWS